MAAPSQVLCDTRPTPDPARRWAVLVNGQSGPPARRAQRNQTLRQQLAPGDGYFETHSLSELDAAAAQIQSSGFQTVAVAGGDGTVGQTIAALARHTRPQRPFPTIALLCGGTMNTIARSMGVPGNAPAERLQSLRRSAKPPTTRSQATLQVDNRIGFLFSSGIMYGFLEAYYARGTGAYAAARLLAQGAVSVVRGGPLAEQLAQRFRASLKLDAHDSTENEDFLLLGAGTVQQVGLGFRPFPLARPGAQCFHALSYTGSLPGLLLGLPLLAVGQADRLRHTRSCACRELTITHTTPLPYALDGDLYLNPGPSTTLRCGPEVRFLI